MSGSSSLAGLLGACALAVLLVGCSRGEYVAGDYWQMHTIDDRSEGADGVDLYDVDGDGDLDAVSGWEESAMVWLHENPGLEDVREPWSRTDIRGGLDMRKVEDARFADLDDDGQIDAIVTATENRSERVGIHWRTPGAPIHNAQTWIGSWVLPAVNYQFIKLAIGQIDGRDGVDIAVGSKSDNKPARLVWYQAPPNPIAENMEQWRAHEIADIEWTDTIEVVDVNGDGHFDILMNYRHHLAWYENPGEYSDAGVGWVEHVISTTTGPYYARCDDPQMTPAAMRLVVGAEISSRTVENFVAWSVSKELDELDQWTGRWLQQGIGTTGTVPRDPERENYAIKSIACGNIDANTRPDIVISTSGFGHGVFALMNLLPGTAEQALDLQVISSTASNSRKGIKHDDVRLADVDLDGDLDIVTTEENGNSSGWWSSRGLGLIWFENPGPDLKESR
jgi:hypothetical protein